MLTVPLCLVGVLPMLYYTGTAVNVQSLLGMIFIVGIKVVQHGADDRLRPGTAAARGTDTRPRRSARRRRSGCVR